MAQKISLSDFEYTFLILISEFKTYWLNVNDSYEVQISTQ